MTKKPPILNIADVDLQESPVPVPAPLQGKYGARRGAIATLIGAQKLGYNLTVVPPGKRAFPLHNHQVNEEMFFVLDGTGELRLGADSYPIRSGDVVACPPGGPDLAHQIVNTGRVDLRYLSVSTMMVPEYVEYPDSKKFGILVDAKTEGGGSTRVRFLSRLEQSLGYYDGEPSE